MMSNDVPLDASEEAAELLNVWIFDYSILELATEINDMRAEAGPESYRLRALINIAQQALEYRRRK